MLNIFNINMAKLQNFPYLLVVFLKCFHVEILFMYPQIIFGRKAVKEEFKYLLAQFQEFCAKDLSMTIYVHLDLNFSTINYHLVISNRQTWHKLTEENFYKWIFAGPGYLGTIWKNNTFNKIIIMNHDSDWFLFMENS